jgi:hypothetical protein
MGAKERDREGFCVLLVVYILRLKAPIRGFGGRIENEVKIFK